jgi:hypothetical protein
MKLVLTPIFCILTLNQVDAWSKAAHRLIADIAAHHISDRARDDMLGLLGMDKWSALRNWLVEESNWADTYATDSSFAESQRYHYVHTTSTCEPYDAARDCGDDPDSGFCLPNAIAYHIDVALNQTIDQKIQIASLKHLVHYMADVHQPLHVGFRSDFGGNNFFVKTVNGTTFQNFHYLWDGEFIWDKTRELKLTHPRKMVDFFKRTSRPLYDSIARPINGVDLYNHTDVDAMVASLVSETSRELTCKIYTNLDTPSRMIRDGSKLSPNYTKRAGDIVYAQVRKAGIRLAALLNSLFLHRHEADE